MFCFISTSRHRASYWVVIIIIGPENVEVQQMQTIFFVKSEKTKTEKQKNNKKMKKKENEGETDRHANLHAADAAG